VADVEGFSLEAVQSFWKRHYRPDNAVLAIVGHVDTEAALAAVRSWFSEASASGEKEERVTRQPDLKIPSQRLGLLEDDVEERTLWVSWPAVPMLHPDEAPLEVLAHVLSYGRGTPLDDRLTFSGKANQSSAFQYAAEVDGRFYVVASSDRTPLTALLKIIDQEVKAIQSEAPTPAAVERGREALRASLLNELEEPLGRAQAMVDCQRLLGKADCLGEQFARYEAVTPKDVQRVAQTYLKEEARVLLSVVPREDRGALKGSQVVELP
jgi:zinc protease